MWVESKQSGWTTKTKQGDALLVRVQIEAFFCCFPIAVPGSLLFISLFLSLSTISFWSLVLWEIFVLIKSRIESSCFQGKVLFSAVVGLFMEIHGSAWRIKGAMSSHFVKFSEKGLGFSTLRMLIGWSFQWYWLKFYLKNKLCVLVEWLANVSCVWRFMWQLSQL